MYVKKKLLGKGAYGKVYLVLNEEDNNFYALKSLEKDKNCLLAFDTEINLLKKLNHQNIIRLYDSFENNTRFNIVLEYAEKGTLGSLISQNIKNFRKFKNNEIQNIILSISNGLNHLHKHNIIHRDIKPENILISKNNVYKISDFGVSRLDNKTKLINTSIGTPYYMAPELIKGKSYNKEVDCWALGCIFYELFTLALPFVGHNMYVLSERICRGYVSLHGIPLDYRTLIKNLLDISKHKRAKIDDVIIFYSNLEKEETYKKNRVKQIRSRRQKLNENNKLNYNQKEYVSPYRYNPKNRDNVSKYKVLPKIVDYRKKKPDFNDNEKSIDEYYKNRKPFFY
jgi:serine/threonine protein kinase